MLNTQEELNHFAKTVIRNAKNRLRKKRASGDLASSLGFDLNTHKNSFSLQFFMLDYGAFVDEGVRGKKSSSRAPKSPFRFKGRSSNGQFEKTIAKWIKQKGIKGRDKKTGRFITDKSLNFLIRRSVINNGIKPSLFFTKPFENAFRKLPDEIVDKFGLDIDDFLESTLNA